MIMLILRGKCKMCQSHRLRIQVQDGQVELLHDVKSSSDVHGTPEEESPPLIPCCSSSCPPPQGSHV